MLRLLAIRTRIVIVVLGMTVAGFAAVARYVPTEKLPETYPAIVGVSLIAFGVALFLSRSLTVPLRLLDEQLRRRVEGQSDEALQVRGHDEVTDFSRTLNEFLVQVDDGVLSLQQERDKNSQEREKLQRESSARKADVELLLDVAERLLGGRDFSGVATKILEDLNSHLNLGWSSLFLLTNEGKSLEMVASSGLDTELSKLLTLEGHQAVRYRPGEGLSGLAISSKEIQIATEGYQDKRFKLFDKQGTHHKKVKNLCAAPLVIDEEALGVLISFNCPTPPGFDEPSQLLLGRVARLLSRLLLSATDYFEPYRESVTGLLIKEFWNEQYGKELSRSDRAGTSLGVGCLELQFSPLVGDASRRSELMGQIGAITKENLRLADLATRDGYIISVLLPHTDSLGTMFMMGRLKDRLDALAFEKGEGKPLFETRVGVASFPDDVVEPGQVEVAASEALEQARKSGDDRLVCYKKTGQEQAKVSEKA